MNKETLTVAELIDVLRGFDKDMPILLGADGTVWEITSPKSVFTQEMDGTQYVVMWDGFWD